MYEKDYIVYLLTNTCNNRTYLGVTNNPMRRLKQHNGEMKGGARYTQTFKETGFWQYYFNDQYDRLYLGFGFAIT